MRGSTPPCDGEPLLAARGLCRSFGRVRVLRDIDLTLAPGETLAVAGPNGAGKSTLLRLLAGLMRPTAGHVRVLGRPLTGDAPDARRAIGLLSHQSLLYDDLTLAENLTFAARLYGLPRPADTASAALDMLEVDHEGLDRLDREILGAICGHFGGGPVGLSTLAVAVGEEQDTIEDVYEPYLLQCGFIKRTPRGRVATFRAFQHLGLEAPATDPSLF